MQKHAASRLHYDFRLEIDGVLKSWSIPKGPSLDPTEKRLAVETEDHPLEYGGFEGVIPEGEYGGGTVLLWDKGVFIPDGDPSIDYERGRLRFRLDGEKLVGAFMLVRMNTPDVDRPNWLLIKSRDGHAQEKNRLLTTRPESVKSGRRLPEIAIDDGASTRQVERAVAADGKNARTTSAKIRAKKHRTRAFADGNPSLRPRKRRPARPSATHGATVAGVTLTSPCKFLYAGITKADLAEYYVSVAPWMLPHARRRVVSLVRCPSGVRAKCFFQRHPRDIVTTGIRTITVESAAGKAGEYLVIDDIRGILGAVQASALELHIWGCRADRVDRPDRMVFDLDPGQGLSMEDVARAALELRAVLAEVGLESFAMTTGGRGLHVVVPLRRRQGFDQVLRFSRAVARMFRTQEPGRYIDRPSKAERAGRIFIDYLRNASTASAICPYSTRARDHAPVAVPLSWAEVGSDLDSRDFDIRTVPERIDRGPDPWHGYFEVSQHLTKSMHDRFGSA